MAATVFIADDHPIVLSGLTSLIASDPQFEVVGTATDGRSALTQLLQLQPDIAVLDLNMPSLTGIEISHALRDDHPGPKVILLAATLTDAEILDATESGTAGVLLKEAAASTLMDCLRCVARGERWQPGEMIETALAQERERRERWAQLSARLTSREKQIVALILRGSSNKEIAYALQISDGTAKVHLNNIFRKLDVTSRGELYSLIGHG